jgi:enoyl-CoA hydratase
VPAANLVVVSVDARKGWLLWASEPSERERHPSAPMSVSTAEVAGVLVATMDDGKVNALTMEVINDLRSAVGVASDQGQPLVITGRDGCYSAGFDLSLINGGDRQLFSATFAEGALLYREIVEAPIPVVASCTGHALAGGALLLLSADYRIGRVGSYRLGLNEVRIGMALPAFAVVMATHRLERRSLTPATMFAEIVSPERAVSMGYLDETVEDALTRACTFAAELATLPPEAFATTKRRIRRPLQQELAALKLR